MKYNLEKLQKSLSAILKQIEDKWVHFDGYYEGGYVDANFICYTNKNGKVFEFAIDDDEPLEYILDDDSRACSICNTPDITPEEAEGHFKKTAIYMIADSLAKKGYKHQAVLWALFNPEQVPEGWTLEYIGKPELTDEQRREEYYESLRKKLELVKFQKWALKVMPEGMRNITFENYSGIHGYDDYDFKTMTVSGYKVYCWSSYLFGGNCNCNNHDPGESFEYDITNDDIDAVKRLIISRLQENVPKL